MIYNLGLDTVTTLYAVNPAPAALAWLLFEGISEATVGAAGILSTVSGLHDRARSSA